MFRPAMHDTNENIGTSSQLRAASWISVAAMIGLLIFQVASPVHSDLHAQIAAPSSGATA